MARGRADPARLGSKGRGRVLKRANVNTEQERGKNMLEKIHWFLKRLMFETIQHYLAVCLCLCQTTPLMLALDERS